MALGVDLGDRRVGLAVSDPEGTVAVGAGTIRVMSEREAVVAVAAAAREREVEVVVVGMPVTLRGTRSAQTLRTERFVSRLEGELGGVAVERWDERLTTVAAQRALRTVRAEGARPAGRERVDEIAATLILQGWLDARRASRGRSGSSGGEAGEESDVPHGG
jgi:putative Holliday junction resolvase